MLVGAAFFEITTGLLNINQWYVFGFGFVPVHYALAWVMAGALLVHLAVKLPIIRRSLAREPKSARAELAPDAEETAAPPEEEQAGRDRRGFVLGALGVTGVLTLLTVGQAVTPLSRL
ncbi:MAG: molybdopterin-binding protein, partial [Propionibacteriaceae bacterium]|nr:molybdopterin-binding protein [Propionibacteriaceae bacterium]